jgi:HPt (histidine-containing phosphotransfer) domain-containing protein/CheY-like chemotaxis protein
MSSLHFLLVHSDPRQSDRIASILASVNHTVLQTTRLEEAGDALFVERFDAVLLGSPVSGLAEFTARLRKVELNQRSFARIPIFSFVAQSSADARPAQSPECDGYLEEPLDLAALSDAVARLAQAVGRPADPQEVPEANGLPVFEPEKFEEQVCYDRDLMIEIIDLFLEERQYQVEEMRNSLAGGDYAMLSRMAHTIKGSLGSLHATRARCRAQELELAAKAEDGRFCGDSFAALERDLVDLEPELLAMRSLPAAR